MRSGYPEVQIMNRRNFKILTNESFEMHTRVVGDVDVQMVENVVMVRLIKGLVHDAGVSSFFVRIDVAADRESVGAVLLIALHRIAEGKRHVIDDEMMLIVAQNGVRDRGQMVALIAIVQIVGLRAQMPTCSVQEADLVR